MAATASVARPSRVPAVYDLSHCLNDGAILTCPRALPDRLVVAGDPVVALSKAEALRADEIAYHKRELVELTADLERLKAERKRLSGLLCQSRGEIGRLERLKFRVE